MKLKLPGSIASSQDLTSLTMEIHDYARWFAHESIKKQVDAKDGSQSPTLSSGALELLRDWKADQQISSQSLDVLIKTLEEYASDSPSMTITLAASPTSSLKTTLVSWCRENVAPDILVSFRFNSSLLGGMVVQYGSHVFDWSFKRKILENRGTFPEVLRSV
ncbi:MAG TPA: F0F1 ATP synthase subunit delta [Candidatus Saccharimonadales bacterium]|nr:F0F1 ATP synthase subunit delta [Candidatus Saccharimonadales bacterium]